MLQNLIGVCARAFVALAALAATLLPTVAAASSARA